VTGGFVIAYIGGCGRLSLPKTLTIKLMCDASLKIKTDLQ
jgi:hypothetical protein